MLTLNVIDTRRPISRTGRQRKVKNRGDGALFQLELKLSDAHTAWLAALDRQAEADRIYELIRSGDAPAATKTSLSGRSEAAARRTAAIRPAERAVERAEARLKRVVRLMLAFRASTLAGMECKLRLLTLRLSPAVMPSIEADLDAMGLLAGE